MRPRPLDRDAPVLHAGNVSLVAPMIVCLAAGIVTVAILRSIGARRARERLDGAYATAAATLRSGELESAAIRRARETEARTEALELRSQADDEMRQQVEGLSRREERIAGLAGEVAEEQSALDSEFAKLDERRRQVKSRQDRSQGIRRDAADRRRQARALLQERAGETEDEVRETLARRWLEEARAAAGQRIRESEQLASSPSPEHERSARRVMEIASSRYQNHFLTERNISKLRVGADVCELLLADQGAIHEVLQEVSNVQLHVDGEEEWVRLEGLDGVGREIARRALSRLMKRNKARAGAQSNPRAWAEKIRDNLLREIDSLGKKAFKVLAIPTAHTEIVSLVGALNYRTSYTQNQWLHAVEASFLAGMMASELGLNIKMARRATLMHDIGKALTHKIDGSHAVIGADIARRLGEDEIIANAIGAHHADEPCNSVYAHLVAAADAMSGARPGARREATEGFSARVEDLERIGRSYRGVNNAHAVHGGRELRVYVDESRVGDIDVVELSSEIAAQIADEMTFPGQIKVTVIRSMEAVAIAG